MIRPEKIAGFGSNEEFLEMALSAAHVGSFRWNLTTDELVCSPHHHLIFGIEPGGPALTNTLLEGTEAADAASSALLGHVPANGSGGRAAVAGP